MRPNAWNVHFICSYATLALATLPPWSPMLNKCFLPATGIGHIGLPWGPLLERCFLHATSRGASYLTLALAMTMISYGLMGLLNHGITPKVLISDHRLYEACNDCMMWSEENGPLTTPSHGRHKKSSQNHGKKKYRRKFTARNERYETCTRCQIVRYTGVVVSRCECMNKCVLKQARSQMHVQAAS